MTKVDLYELMLEEFEEECLAEDEIPSVETFKFVWRSKFQTLVIPRYNTLGGCDVCLGLKMQKRQFSSASGEYRNIRDKLNQHLKNVKLEREAQVLRDQTSTHNPRMCWTITTDFMVDLALPWLSTKPKGWFRKKYVSMKVFGYMNSGTKLRYLFNC